MSKKKYEELTEERELFLNRARDCAELTLPLVIRDKGDNATTNYQTPYQSVGSRGVSNICSNLLLSLFPTSTPFFRLLVSDYAFNQFGEEAKQIKTEVDESLGAIEKTVLEELEDKNLRPIIFDVLKNLIIAGNCLVYVQPDGNVRAYSLEDYVCKRDIEGNILQIHVKEMINREVAEQTLDVELPSDEMDDDKEINLFTCIERKEDEYYIYQTIDEQKIKGTESYVKLDLLPFLPLRLTKVTGESYGRSYVESLIGDLSSLESLSKSIVESAAISAKSVFMVNPASLTRAKALAKAKNGDVINGNATDVTTLQVNKSSDMSVAFQTVQNLERRLSFAFNLLDNALPAGGRTTATEINALVNSLEKVLAGTYAMLSSEFMRPLVHIMISRLTQEGKIPELPKEIKLIISVGLTALGRNSDLERLQQFVAMSQQLAPEAFAKKVNQDVLISSIARAIGVEKSIIKTDEQIAMEQQAAMMAQQQLQEQQSAMMQQEQEGKIAEKVAPQIAQSALQENE